MKRSAVAAAIALALIAAFLVIATPAMQNKALAIDNVHWTGSPMTPCFVDAAHCAGHVLGSDDNGRDVAARLIAGGAVTLGIAFLALLGELVVAFGLAFFARHGGRVSGSIAGALAGGMSALPRLPFALLLGMLTFSMLPNGAWPNIWEIAAWFAVIFWPAVYSALRAGALPVDIVRRGLSDLMTIVLVSSTIEFFGYGPGPLAPTWGGMLANAESDIEVAWWAGVFPALCIVAVVVLLDVVRRGLPPPQDAAETLEPLPAASSPA